MKTLIKKAFVLGSIGFLFASSTANALSTEFIKRAGKSCTGTCDQPSQVCGDDKKLIKWCKKHCAHKIDIEKVCEKHAAATPASASCAHKDTVTQRHAAAAVAARHAYDYGRAGGFKGPDFKEVSHLHSKSTDLVAWAGIKDCVLYVAFKGTDSKRDVVKDLQIGAAHLAGKVGLSGFASRGEYNNAVNRGIKFFHDTVKKVEGQFSHTVITGHSLGGGIAMNVGDSVARGHNDIEVVTLNAPGTDFLTNKEGKGHEDVQATHIRSPGDLVSKWGNTTEGETLKTRGGSLNPLTAHSSHDIKEELQKKSDRESKKIK